MMKRCLRTSEHSGITRSIVRVLKSSKIPVSDVGIGPVHRKDVMRAASILEKAKE
jgi:translation initiation factor 5B